MKKLLFLFSAGLAIPQAFGQTTPSAILQAGAVITLPANSSPADIAIVDVDHDGRPDLGVAQRGLNSVAVYRQASTGSYTLPPAVYAVGLGPSALVALDFGYTGKNVHLTEASVASASASRPVTVRLFDGQGQPRAEQCSHGERVLRLATDKLPAGLYFVHIMREQQVLSRQQLKIE